MGFLGFPLSFPGAFIVGMPIFIALEVEVRKVDLAVVHAKAVGAFGAISLGANAIAMLKIPEHLVGIQHLVLLQAHPHGCPAIHFIACLLRCFHEHLDSTFREAIVREMQLLQGITGPDEAAQGLCCIIIDIILVEFQNPQPLTARAKL